MLSLWLNKNKINSYMLLGVVKMGNGYFYLLVAFCFLFCSLCFGVVSVFTSNLSTIHFSVYLYVFLLSMTLFNQGYFSIQCYTNKTYFLISFILISLMGLTSVYAILFVHIKNYDLVMIT